MEFAVRYRCPRLSRAFVSGILVLMVLVSSLLTGVVSAQESPPNGDATDAPVHDHSTHDHSVDAAFEQQTITGEDGDPCAAMGMQSTPAGCTHGPDDHFLPNKASMHTALPLAGDPQTALPAAACVGNGQDGPRIQVIYARASDRTDRFATSLGTIRTVSDGVNQIFVNSAAKTGGVRHVRFVHDSLCRVIVENVVLTPAGDNSFGNTINELIDQGYNRADRKYLVFVDVTGVLCGIANLMSDSDKAAMANANSAGGMYARVDANCWAAGVAAHEVMHNLGGVQDDAPNTTFNRPTDNPGGHCIDERDVMCYSDYDADGNGSLDSPPMQMICPDPSSESLFDCGDNDYFHTNPGAGNYLATHWNTADNPFLIGGATISCPDYYVYESDDYINWGRPIAPGQKQQHAFCADGDADHMTFDATAGQQFRVETSGLAGGTDTDLGVWRWDGSVYWGVAFNDDHAGGPASRVEFTASHTTTYVIRVEDVAGAFGEDNVYDVQLTRLMTDTTAPSVTRVRTRLTPKVVGSPSSATVDLVWSGSDAGSGVGMYEVQRSVNQGAWQSLALPTLDATRMTTFVDSGKDYRYRVRATDGAGNTSAWLMTTAVEVSRRGETNGSIVYTGTWYRPSIVEAIGGKTKRARVNGSWATLSFTGTAVGWIGIKGPDRGKAQVWIDGVKAGTIDLYHPNFEPRELLFVKNGLTDGNHTIEIRTIGKRNTASTNNWVDIDDFLVVGKP
jgi:hypothetical protein